MVRVGWISPVPAVSPVSVLSPVLLPLVLPLPVFSPVVPPVLLPPQAARLSSITRLSKSARNFFIWFLLFFYLAV